MIGIGGYAEERAQEVFNRLVRQGYLKKNPFYSEDGPKEEPQWLLTLDGEYAVETLALYS